MVVVAVVVLLAKKVHIRSRHNKLMWYHNHIPSGRHECVCHASFVFNDQNAALFHN
jgi:hypothetical protein